MAVFKVLLYKYAGHEEIVPVDLLAFPENTAGNFLIAGSGDHTGFIFDDAIMNPDSFATHDIGDLADTNLNPLKKSASYAFCENQPDHLAAVITNEWTGTQGGLLTSNNGGITWQLKNGYDVNDKKSQVEISSSDPQNIIILNNNGLKYSLNGGDTEFTHANGSSNLSETCAIPFEVNCLTPTDFSGSNINNNVFAAARNITADKSLGCVFYFYDWDGTFSISTNSGEDWCVVNSEMPVTSDKWNRTRIISIPGHPGHLWININNELYFSENGGADWINKSEETIMDEATAISFGLGFSESYPAIYVYGSLDEESKNYFFRSDDAGDSWIRISDHTENELWGDNKIIAGDRNVAGRLYAVASGQGVVFGNPVESEEPCNTEELIVSGTFDIESSNIPDFSVHDGGNAVASGSINAIGEAFINITNSGDFNYQVQLWQDDLAMEQGQEYVIRTKMRAEQNRVLTIKLRNRADGTTYLEEDIDISLTSQYYDFIFIAPVDDSDLRLTYLMGSSDENVYFDEISMNVVCEDTSCLADFDNNGLIGVSDLTVLLSNFGCTANCIADLDNNGIVSSVDLQIMLVKIGTDCD